MTTLHDVYCNIFKQYSDLRVYGWPFMQDPSHLLALICVYLSCVFKILPGYMKHRQPYDLKGILTAYNIYQIVACMIMVYGIATSGWTTHYTIGCQNVDYSHDKMAVRMARYMWWHMILKASELLETIFFVLRKKSNQVSVLHVYHHITTLMTAWLACKYAAGGMTTFTVLLNCSVHTLMYSYYLLSSCGSRWQKQLNALKSKLTVIQIVQLGLILIHSMQVFLPGCQLKSAMFYIYVYYILSIVMNIILFLHFYKKTYNKKSI